MIPVYTATYDRPDIARIWNRAVKATLDEDHATAIAYAHEPPGVADEEQSWQFVGIPLAMRPQMAMALRVMPQSGPRLFIEEDIIPVRQWRAADYLGHPAVLQGPRGQPWWGMCGYLDGPGRPLMHSDFRLIPQRLITDGGCPEWLPGELCQPAIEAKAKIVGEHFLHIDKVSSRHGANEAKERLVAALKRWTDRLPVSPKSKPASMPSFARKAVNFTKAAARHIANKGRQCTDEEVAARYAICQACPLLVEGRCTHKNCGCRVSPKRALVSKLSWASESCPIGEWGAV